MAALANTDPSRNPVPGRQILALHSLPEKDDDEPDSAEVSLASILSSDLLRGHKAVSIRHNGFIYRLQATRLGKLILTK